MTAFCASTPLVRRRPRSALERASGSNCCLRHAPYCAVQGVRDYIRDAVLDIVPSETAVTISETTVGPGQHNEHFRAETSPSGNAFMCKVSRRGGLDAFEGEAASLSLLGKAAGDDIIVPQVLATGTIDSGLRAFSIFPWTDFAPFGSSIPAVQQSIGRSLARIHMRSTVELEAVHQGRYGFQTTTWLGGIQQDNSWSDVDDWSRFFIERRLQPRLEEAMSRFGESTGYGTSNEAVLALSTLGQRVCEPLMMEYLFDDVVVRPALIHGDLFMGNCGAIGPKRHPACVYSCRSCDCCRSFVVGMDSLTAVSSTCSISVILLLRGSIYDPAAYFAHDELDLALSTMWGRFSDSFYDAYREERGAEQPRFKDRQEFYRLYYLLSMLVLHGPGFGSNGTSEAPNGYFERCVDCLTKLVELVK